MMFSSPTNAYHCRESLSAYGLFLLFFFFFSFLHTGSNIHCLSIVIVCSLKSFCRWFFSWSKNALDWICYRSICKVCSILSISLFVYQLNAEDNRANEKFIRKITMSMNQSDFGLNAISFLPMKFWLFCESCRIFDSHFPKKKSKSVFLLCDWTVGQCNTIGKATSYMNFILYCI